MKENPEFLPLTNKHNLPEAICRACLQHRHKGGKYSASMLADSPRQVWLKRRHEGEMVQDVVDRVWALVGTTFHKVVEGMAKEGEVAEEYMEETIQGVTVSGMGDLYQPDDEAVVDYKTTSAWSMVYNSRSTEWTKQLNVYAWMHRKRGRKVSRLRIVALLRDWAERNYKQGGNYPETMIASMDLPLWFEEEQEAWIRGRVALFESCKEVPDDLLPPCTDEERWWNGKERKSMRCEKYCVGKICNQYRKEIENAKG